MLGNQKVMLCRRYIPASDTLSAAAVNVVVRDATPANSYDDSVALPKPAPVDVTVSAESAFHGE